MRTVLVHVGMPKAGSTSLQLSLHGYDDGRFRTARLGPACHSMPLMAAFSDPDHPFLSRRASDPDAIRRIGERCRARLAREVALGRDTLVLSGEALGSLTAAGVAAMDRFLAGHGGRMEAVAYVREPVGFASSAFQQAVKAGRDEFDMRPCRPGYRAKSESLLAVLGPGRVRFLEFRRDSLAGGSVVEDFAGRTGMDMARITEARANESLSAEAVALLFFWNQQRQGGRWSPDHTLARTLMARLLAETFPGRFRVAPHRVRAVTVEADVAWMERTGGFGLRHALDGPDEAEAGAIGSEADLAARRDAALPALAALLDRLGVELPPRPGAAALMQRLFQHALGEARREVRSRRRERRAAEQDLV